MSDDAMRPDPHQDIWRDEWRSRLRDETRALRSELSDADASRRREVLSAVAERLRSHAGQAGFFEDAPTQSLCREAVSALEIGDADAGAFVSLIDDTLVFLSAGDPGDDAGRERLLERLREVPRPVPAEDRLMHLAAVARVVVDGWAARGEAWPASLATAAEELSRASADALVGAYATAEPRRSGSGPVPSEPQAIARGLSGTGTDTGALAEDLETLRDLMRDEGVPARVTSRFDALLRRVHRERRSTPAVLREDGTLPVVGLRVGERRFAVESARLLGVHVEHAGRAERESLAVRGASFEVVRARSWFPGEDAGRPPSRAVYALMSVGDRSVALAVDEVLGELALAHTRTVPDGEFAAWPRVGLDRLGEEWPVLDPERLVAPEEESPRAGDEEVSEEPGRPSLAPLLRSLSRRSGEPGA